MWPRVGIVAGGIGLAVLSVAAVAHYGTHREARTEPVIDEASILSPSAKERPRRVAMSAAFVSEQGVPVYGEIISYLSEKTGVRYELVSGLGYGTINEMLKSGVVDYGFVCGYPYILAHDKPRPEVDVLAGPIMKNPRYGGKPVYFSDLIVRKDSPLRSLRDLAGRTYVYNEELSNSGYNMPRSHLVELGLTHGFFGKVLRSGSHEESIRMVAEGLADASYVDSLVLEYDRDGAHGPAAEVRVIESLGPSPVVPLVASSKTSAEERERLMHQLLTMHLDPRGRQILDKALVARFVAVSDKDYDPLRAMDQRAKDEGFLVIK